jgi:hypothetical protein
MSKRQRFIITSVISSLGFIGIQFLQDQYRFAGIAGLGIITTVLLAWALHESLRLDMTFLSLLLPFYFTAGVGLFWFLLPVSVFARIPIVLLYGIGMYALCLTANVYTVSTIRTIALLRAARGVGFILTLLTFFLVFDALLSLRWPIYVNSVVIALTSFPLFLQGFWSIPLERNFSSELVKYSVISAVSIAELALALFFWPVTVVVGSLFLTVFCYMLLGMGQSKLEGRLFPQTVREYLVVGIAVFIGMFMATSWNT